MPNPNKEPGSIDPSTKMPTFEEEMNLTSVTGVIEWSEVGKNKVKRNPTAKQIAKVKREWEIEMRRIDAEHRLESLEEALRLHDIGVEQEHMAHHVIDYYELERHADKLASAGEMLATLAPKKRKSKGAR